MRQKNFISRGTNRFEKAPHKGMNTNAVVFASPELMALMDDVVEKQITNVAGLPGIKGPAIAMPDAHLGYGFPIGGIAAFDVNTGVVCAGGVGFDIACGVRSLRTGLSIDEVMGVQESLADALYAMVPSGVGKGGPIRLGNKDIDKILHGGAKWAVDNGYGSRADLDFIEESGTMRGADAAHVSDQAKKRQRDQLGTLGSGNHYLELQAVEQIFDAKAADAFGISEGDVLLTIHCGSRGLGHQIGQDYMKAMLKAAPKHGLVFKDRELACAPAQSSLGQRYLGAMRCGINAALANRQIISHFTAEAFMRVLPQARLSLIYDVSHNTCKQETHRIGKKEFDLLVHRKGATRALPPGHPDVPPMYSKVGHPAFIGGSMGTPSFILTGTKGNASLAFSSVCHGAGRAMSRNQAKKSFKGGQIVEELRGQGIIIRTGSYKGAAEEAPGAYKNIEMVIDATVDAGLANKIAQVRPLACVKG